MPSNNPNARATLVPFSSTYQPKKKGRKPNLLKKYISGEESLSKLDIQAMAVYLLNCPREKLQEIVKDAKQPMVMVSFSAALLGDMTYKKTTTIDMLVRIIGDGDNSGKGSTLAELPESPEGDMQFARYEYPELKNVTEGVDPQEKEG